MQMYLVNLFDRIDRQSIRLNMSNASIQSKRYNWSNRLNRSVPLNGLNGLTQSNGSSWSIWSNKSNRSNGSSRSINILRTFVSSLLFYACLRRCIFINASNCIAAIWLLCLAVSLLPATRLRPDPSRQMRSTDRSPLRQRPHPAQRVHALGLKMTIEERNVPLPPLPCCHVHPIYSSDAHAVVVSRTTPSTSIFFDRFHNEDEQNKLIKFKKWPNFRGLANGDGSRCHCRGGASGSPFAL